MATYYETIHDITDFVTFGGWGEPVAELVEDHMYLSDDALREWAVMVSETLGLSTQDALRAVFSPVVTDTFGMYGRVLFILDVIIEEVIDAADTATQLFVLAIELRDSLVATGVAPSNAVANILVSSAFAANDSTGKFFGFTVEELAEFGDAATPLFVFMQTLLDQISMVDAVAEIPTIAFTVPESIGLDESVSAGAVLQEVLQEEALIYISLPFADQVYTGWVMNAVNTAVTRYPEYNVNSMCYDGKRYLVAMDGGIYELEGDDDDSLPIDAWVRTGVYDFNVPERKGVPYAYLAARSNGSLVLKVIADEDKEYWYELEHVDDNLKTSRTKIGRGLKMAYMQFELRNLHGADFEVDKLEFIPVVLKRRI
jgi:hypothetical protein